MVLMVVATAVGALALIATFQVHRAGAVSMTFTSDTSITTDQTIASGEWIIDIIRTANLLMSLFPLIPYFRAGHFSDYNVQDA